MRASSARACAGLCALLAFGGRDAYGQSELTGTLVVLNKAEASASVIDLASRQMVATLPTGDGPHEAVVSADGRTVVGTDYGGRVDGSSLTVIDLPTLRVIRTINLGEHRRPHGVSFLPGDTLVAVTSESSRHVVVVRVADGAIVSAIPTEQSGSHMLAVVGDAKTIYTSNIGDNSVSQLDMVSGRLTRTFDVPPQPEAITVTRDGREVWVGSNAEGSVNVVDTQSGRVAAAARGFGWPYRILITPDNAQVLIPDLRGHVLRFFDRATHAELGSLAFPEAGPQGITLLDDRPIAFLSLSRQNRVAIIDLTTREVRGHLPTGAGPDGIAYSRVTVQR